MFKKAISSCANKLGFINGTDAITRIKDTKTTHNWRLENNTGENPYTGEKVYVARSQDDKRRQKAYFFATGGSIGSKPKSSARGLAQSKSQSKLRPKSRSVKPQVKPFKRK